ncbi:hypothetical protein WR25_02743 [Diploscapter pachys]|uniref:Flp family type IVb pilin n=1 Tax=Diploscapter pachys TaxID=2018661 RepID=A0A2A2K805_9BILA|nr:hypothetical protein WR25_02743 [Diploscapter pachys]
METGMLAIRKFIKNSKGATAIEYGLIAALIAVAAIAAMKGLGTKLTTTFNNGGGPHGFAALFRFDDGRGAKATAPHRALAVSYSRPIARNFARRSRRSVAASRPDSDASASRSASPSRRIASAGSRCAPPSGSGTIVSITPKVLRSCAVTRIASAASAALSAVRHRIDAQPSGLITE